MVKPNFFIVGAPKCGTTALYTYLASHPQIFMSKIKEPTYFGKHSAYKDEMHYLDLFKDVGDAIRIGEATPSYLRDPQAAKEIHVFSPDAKIIIMIRNYVDMIYSYYWQNRMTGREKSSSFAEALARQQTDPDNRPPSVPLYLNLLYADHVEQYFNLFGRENVHVIIFDDFKRNTLEVYKDVLRFLEVNEDFVTDFRKVNSHKNIRSPTLQKVILRLGLNVVNIRRFRRSRLARQLDSLLPTQPFQFLFNVLRRIYYSEESPPPIDDNLLRELQIVFRSDAEKLSILLGRDLSSWYN